MNESDFNITSIVNSIPNLDPNCVGDYTTIILAILLFFSEALPFYKRKCENNDVVDLETTEPVRPKRESVLEDGQGLLHTAFSFYRKYKK